MPNEVEMNGFLYSILKQMDLKNIDWEAVAKDRAITNGHAARMRFSRFKSAQDGREVKPRKPRVTKAPAVGAKARAAVKKSKTEKEKKKEKKEPVTPPATPIKSDVDEDEMALDSVARSGMDHQLPLPTEPATFNIKADPEPEQEGVHDMQYVKAEPDMASETSLESADFGQTVDLLGHVNIDNFSRPVFKFQVPSTPQAVMTSPDQIMTPRALMTPEMSLSPTSIPGSLHRSRMTPELLTQSPMMNVGLPERALFHRHYSNGMPLPVPGSRMGSGGKDLGGFEEYLNGRMGEDLYREPIVKEEQRWDDCY